MKRALLFLLLLFPAGLLWAQVLHEAEYFELNSPIPAAESHEYHASSYVRLAIGFQAKPEAGSYVRMKTAEDIDLLEWYYEILNEDGSITYQHLLQSGDTIVQDEPTHILVRINTLYDKEQHDEVTHEYIYERNKKVYWWNKTLEEFTVLYDFGAEEGDSWTITVGEHNIVVRVDEVEEYAYEGKPMRILRVTDVDNLFSGTIVCGVGHLISFFPERLMQKEQEFRVNGIRCFWRNGKLVFKYGDCDCDNVFEQFHHGVGDPIAETGFQVYPNPNDGVIMVATGTHTSQQSVEYRIINLMGQTLLTGRIESENQPIDVSALPAGMYFITIAGESKKLIINR